MVLEHGLSLLELSPRAPLLPRCAVLQPAEAAAAPHAVLREARCDAPLIRLASLALSRPEPEAALQVGRDSNGPARHRRVVFGIERNVAAVSAAMFIVGLGES